MSAVPSTGAARQLGSQPFSKPHYLLDGFAQIAGRERFCLVSKLTNFSVQQLLEGFPLMHIDPWGKPRPRYGRSRITGPLDMPPATLGEPSGTRRDRRRLSYPDQP